MLNLVLAPLLIIAVIVLVAIALRAVVAACVARICLKAPVDAKRALLAEGGVLLVTPVLVLLSSTGLPLFTPPLYVLAAAYPYGRVYRKPDGAPVGYAAGLLVSFLTTLAVALVGGALFVYAVMVGGWSR